MVKARTAKSKVDEASVEFNSEAVKAGYKI
jgi:hypothetical protein